MGCIPCVRSTIASQWKPRQELGKAGMDSMRNASGPLWETFMQWTHSCFTSNFAPKIAQIPHMVESTVANEQCYQTRSLNLNTKGSKYRWWVESWVYLVTNGVRLSTITDGGPEQQSKTGMLV